MGGVARASVSTQRLLLLQRREPHHGHLAITGDRGLAGGFNAQIGPARGRARVSSKPRGRRSAGSPRVARAARRCAFAGSSLRPTGRVSATAPTTATRRRSRTSSPSSFVAGEVDRVVVIYNHFESPLVQRVTEQEVLPIPEHLLETDDEERRQDAERGDFIYEPEPEEILARLLPVYLETEIYRALLESAASEQARMTAMRNASKNAGELIDTLTLQMNRARQAEITQEILEVVAGADALTA